MNVAGLQDVRRILCIGAHADDIEIGCGGTILRLLAESTREVRWVVFSGNEQRQEEARASAGGFMKSAGSSTFQQHAFEDGYFPAHWREIKSQMAELARVYAPDLVFTHRLEDRHQDHQLLAQLTWNHFRSPMIWEYEIPKYEADLGSPNLYVRLDETVCQRKIDLLTESFPSQRDKPWFDEETFWSLLRLRGTETDCRRGYAEAFTVRKMAI